MPRRGLCAVDSLPYSVVELDAQRTVSFEPVPDGSDRPASLVIDLTFNKAPISLEAITFENYYCATLSVSHTHVKADDTQRGLHTAGRAPTWTTVLPPTALMADADYEEDAQDLHEILGAQLNEDFDRQRVTRLRLECHQPSPNWREFELRRLRFYTRTPPAVPENLPHRQLCPEEEQAGWTPALTEQPTTQLHVYCGRAPWQLAASIVAQLQGLSSAASEIRGVFIDALAAPGAAPYDASAASGVRAAPYRLGVWADELRLPPARPIGSAGGSSDRHALDAFGKLDFGGTAGAPSASEGAAPAAPQVRLTLEEIAKRAAAAPRRTLEDIIKDTRAGEYSFPDLPEPGSDG